MPAFPVLSPLIMTLRASSLKSPGNPRDQSFPRVWRRSSRNNPRSMQRIPSAHFWSKFQANVGL
jgi:hypothetical protein